MRCRATPPSAPGWRRSSPPTGWPASSNVWPCSPRRARNSWTCATRGGSSAPWRSPSSWGIGRCRSHGATTGRPPGSGCGWTPPTHQRRIAARARAQFDAGLIEEARGLRERYDPALPAFSAIGYREAWAVLDGTLSRQAAIDLDAQRNVTFAKRQATWFRAEPGIAWLDAAAPDLDRDAARRISGLVAR